MPRSPRLRQDNARRKPILDSQISGVIAAVVGHKAEWIHFPYPRNINSPLSLLLANLSKKLEVAIDFSLVRGVDPECFLLEIEDRNVVVIDSTYLGSIHGLVSTFFGELPIKDEQLYTDTKIKLCVDLVQLFIPLEIFTKAARDKITANIRSFSAKSHIFLYYPNSPSDIEMLPYDEYYFSLWYFFAAHEVAHCIRKTGNWSKFVVGDLGKIVITSTTMANTHAERIREALGEFQYDLFARRELEDLFQANDVESLIDEIFCDQVAFIIVLEMMSELKCRGFFTDLNLEYFAKSIFMIFAAHQKLLELRRLRQRLGMFGIEGMEGLRSDRRRNEIRFAYLRDLLACLVPCADSTENLLESDWFKIFGYYGSMGIREMAADIQAVKQFQFDPLIDTALGIVFEDCLDESTSDQP